MGDRDENERFANTVQIQDLNGNNVHSSLGGLAILIDRTHGFPSPDLSGFGLIKMILCKSP
jgi:hypothetical protein